MRVSLRRRRWLWRRRWLCPLASRGRSQRRFAQSAPLRVHAGSGARRTLPANSLRGRATWAVVPAPTLGRVASTPRASARSLLMAVGSLVVSAAAKEEEEEGKVEEEEMAEEVEQTFTMLLCSAVVSAAQVARVC